MYNAKELTNIKDFKENLREIKNLRKNISEDRNIVIKNDPIFGKYIKIDGTTIAIDHWNPKADIIYISHGHMDHIPNIPKKALNNLFEEKIKTNFICSKITKNIAKFRTYNKCDFPCSMWLLGEDLSKRNSIEYNGIKISLIENGHTYGSTSLLIEGSKTILYTSDFITRDREFLNGNEKICGLRPIKCDILIMECTFGSPKYVFPPFLDIQKDMNDYINRQISENHPIILLAYSFGKSQILLNMLNSNSMIILERNIVKIIEILEQNGIQFPNWEPYGNYNKNNLSELNDYICIIPPYSIFNNPFKNLISNGAKVILFSGNVLNNSYQNKFPADKYIPYSDHCDFNCLFKFVKDSNAKNIYLEHGRIEEFFYYLLRNLRYVDYINLVCSH